MKQVIIVRNDLKMGKGKIAAQSSHASLIAALNAKRDEKNWYESWFKHGMGKIVLKVDSEEELNRIFQSHQIAVIQSLWEGFDGCTRML